MSAKTFRLALVAVAASQLAACDWFTDFKNQPRIEPWEPVSQHDNDTTHAPRGNPAFAVPVTGSYAPGYAVSYKQMPQTLDSLSTIANPTPVSAASLENGRKYYTVNCAVCHGVTGEGNGPVTKIGNGQFLSKSLLTPQAQGYTDGYIFGMIRNGRGLMPTYNRIEEHDRWDVVNYVRALQGKVPNTTGGNTPYGVPGQNGPTVPGATNTAPTRPAPMWRAASAPAAAPTATPVQGAPTDSATRRTP